MQVTITAVGPDHKGLADPIVHYVATEGANIAEIQMYDRDTAREFAMLVRLDWPDDSVPIPVLRERMNEIGRLKGLSIRTWSRCERPDPPRIALCTTFRPEPATAVLEAMRGGRLRAVPALMVGNRDACRGVADRFGVPWESIGDDAGNPDNDRLVELIDGHDIDYIVLARYMRILPAGVCWRYAGGRIVNLHHGLLPPFPGFRPYDDAYGHHMLSYGATVHFIVPELDAGNQTIHQSTFSVFPGTPLDEIKRLGETQHEPAALVEGLRRVVDREVTLHFHRVIRTGGGVTG